MSTTFTRAITQEAGLARGRYNQIANFVLAQSEINIAIGDKAPEKYFQELAEQCDGGKKKYGGITKRYPNEGESPGKLPARNDARRHGSGLRRLPGGAPEAHGAQDQAMV